MKEKSFYRQLFVLVFPIAGQSLISALVGSADVVMLGAQGQSAIAAVSLANQVTFILTLLYMGIAGGTGILTAQYWGKGDNTAIQHILCIGCIFSAGISVLFFFTALFIPGTLMSLLTNDPELIALGAGYLKALSFSYLFMSLSQVYLAVVKSMERARLSALITSASLLINIGLNAVAIFVLYPGQPAKAVVGVAMATAAARAVECIACLIHSFTKNAVRLRITMLFHPEKQLLKDFIRYSLPVLANYFVWGSSLTVLAAVMGRVSSEMVAANSVASVMKNLVLVLCSGISQGGSILIGKSLGEGNVEEARRRGGKIVVCAAVSGVAAGLLLLAIRPLAMDIVDLSPSARQLLDSMLLICAIYCIGKALNSTVIGGIFCAGGDAKFGMVCDGIVMWGVMVPICAILAFTVDVSPLVLYIVMSLDEFIKLPFMAIRYKKYRWLKNITQETIKAN